MRDIRFDSFAGTFSDLLEVALFLDHASVYVVQDDAAWRILYNATREIRRELCEVA